MLNHYKTLGIPKSADFDTIRSAYKKLAFLYHPDRNPGNKSAEEFFKQVNDAYQILSDHDKRKRYDFLINYQYQRPPTSNTSKKPYRSRQEKSVYDRYGKYDWRNAPKYKKAPFYRFDKNYAQIQFVTLFSMVLLGALILGVNKYWNYLDQQKRLEVEVRNKQKLEMAHRLYNEGKHRDAIKLVIKLDNQNPYESRFYEERDRMISSLFQMASLSFNNQSYPKAVQQLEIVKDYERPMKMKTWQMLADAYEKMGKFKKAAFALDRMLERDKFNIRLCVKIARLHNDQLNNEPKALEYYDEAKLLFKEFQASTYGDAFELVVQPQKLPDFYHELFLERAKLNMKVGNHEEALTDYNWAIFLRPDNGLTYHMRAHAKRMTGLLRRACLDWQRALERGHFDSQNDLNQYCQ